MSASAVKKAVSQVRKAAAHLPGIEDRLSDAARELDLAGEIRVKGKLVCWFKKGLGGALVIRCPVEDKALLIEAAPEIYFETDHYKGWPAVLVRLDKIGAKELKHRLEAAWRSQASKRLVREFAEEIKREPSSV